MRERSTDSLILSQKSATTSFFELRFSSRAISNSNVDRTRMRSCNCMRSHHAYDQLR